MDTTTPEHNGTHTQKPNRPNLLTLLALVLAVGALVGLAVVYKSVQDLSTKVDNINQSPLKQATDDQKPPTSSTETITSGKGGFSVNFPNGWGPIYKDTLSDYMTIPGQTQPTGNARSKVDVREVKGFGGDGAAVLTISLADLSTAAAPQGVQEEFVIGKGEDSIKGTKYSYAFNPDKVVGMGIQRLTGDRDYTYRIPAKNGLTLLVTYSVYASDPRNLVQQVDELVRTITLK